MHFINAYEDAIRLGNAIYENMVMLGALYSIMNLGQYIPRSIIEEAIKANVRRDVDKNIKAFVLGLKYGSGTA
jgi:indolepyruvate ferredoxin oxidoreductase beta subunit